MDPTPQMAARTLLRRDREHAARMEERRRALRSALPAIASMLRERYGATEVWVFGSLAWGAVHEGSDVDLAVRGVARDRLAAAMLDAEEGIEAVVELFDLEALPPGFAERIVARGERLA